MPEVLDGFDTYYAERLWLLLPAVYRAADSNGVQTTGPLREFVNRIGAQMAVIRRSIDRLWADQSIESCDDWVIPYIGDLLAVDLVDNLNPQGQRLDVAKTIHYRRRKGTFQVLEELARDVTGWTTHAAEGFRRLARSRHGLDPVVGAAAFPNAATGTVGALLAVEGLAGALTGTPAGGFADLRAAHGAALVDTPFDESFHSVDVRRGRGAVGHMAIPRLLLFAWRLTSFPVLSGTPVAVSGAPNQYAFDPTGRQIPLFLPPPAAVDDFSDTWAPALEWQVPGPLTSSLESALRDTGGSPPPPARAPYPAPAEGLPPRYSLGGGAQLASIWPEQGLFTTTGEPPGPVTADYQYGFPAQVGAGPYNRDLVRDPPAVAGSQAAMVSGGSGLDAALAAAAPTATVTIEDSLTYTALGTPPAPVASLVIGAGPSQRPVLRPASGAEPWVFSGGPGAQLVLDGLTLSGCDIVLRGPFDSVRITTSTIDPGTAAPGSPPLAISVDERPLSPSHVFVEADPATPGGIASLEIDRSVIGPIRSRFGGTVDQLTITDSIVQGLPESADTVVYDPLGFALGLLSGVPGASSAYPLSAAILAAIPGLAATLKAYVAAPESQQGAGLPLAVLNALDTLILGPSIYNQALFSTVVLSPRAQDLAAAAATLDTAHRIELNRALLADAFPVALGVAAIALAGASVELSRVTVLGRMAAKQLACSDSILADFVAIDDTQNGFLRFSAYVAGSATPRRSESAAVGSGGALFTSTSFGDPGYAQLLENADAAIVAGGGQAVSISAGAENGSEMGAFSNELGPVKENGLLVKYTEYMPLGLAPVIAHVT